MTYIATGAKIDSLTINGADYTSQLVSWQASDSSAYKNGLLSTQGDAILAGIQGGPYMTDYDRNNFKRGQKVILTVRMPSGSIVRHPRGLLYVIDTEYNVETEQTTILTGCRLALASLTSDVDALVDLAPIPLDPLRTDYNGISGSFSAAGSYLYQTNTGALESRLLFEGDTTSRVASGEWVSVVGQTSLSATPLAGAAAIPDEVSLAYDYATTTNPDIPKVEQVTTTSRYFLTYPVVYYRRSARTPVSSTPNPSPPPSSGNGWNRYPSSRLGSTTGSRSSAGTTGLASSCGNTPAPPAGSERPVACNDGYELFQQPLIKSATRSEVSTTEYAGPAGQVSLVVTETRGHAVEANQQYFADAYAYCRYTWGTRCQPNGSCSTEDGMRTVLLGRTIQVNEYGSAGELVKTTVDTYENVLAGAQPFDWRAGNNNGVPQDFRTLGLNNLYRVERVQNEMYVDGIANVQDTTTWTSATRSGAGIRAGSIDALDGVVTTERRRSVTISANPDFPDSVAAPAITTAPGATKITVSSGRYLPTPSEAGPYVVQEQMPVPLLMTGGQAVADAVAVYSDYLVKIIKGDAYGLQIGESLREDIVANWRPGMPLYYSDPKRDHLMTMRMDACAWGADAEGCAVVFNGLWTGWSNGTVVLGSNLYGVGTPVIPPKKAGAMFSLPINFSDDDPNAVTPPTVEGETEISSGPLLFDIDIDFAFGASVMWYGNDGVIPILEPETLEAIEMTFTCWIDGQLTGPGSFYSPSSTGGLPVATNGLLVTDSALILNPDLFEGQTNRSGGTPPEPEPETPEEETPEEETPAEEEPPTEQETGPFEVSGYYPLYDTEAGAAAAGDGSAHQHELSGETYYMPNGLTMGVDMFHGDYNNSGGGGGGY